MRPGTRPAGSTNRRGRPRLSLLPPGTGASPETVESYLTQLIVRGLPQILGVHPRI
jgi:hypothetical protein